MNAIVKIHGTKVERMEYSGQPVISLSMVDKLHKRPEGTARHAFNRHRGKLIQGADYFDLPYEEWAGLVGHQMYDQRGQMADHKKRGKGHKGNMTFLSSIGYTMLVKVYTDDLSWAIQREIVTKYFEESLTEAELKEELLDAYRLIKQLSRRKGNKVQEADNAEIVKLKKAGLQTGQICEKTGWSPTTIKKHVADARQLGLFDLPQLA